MKTLLKILLPMIILAASVYLALLLMQTKPPRNYEEKVKPDPPVRTTTVSATKYRVEVATQGAVVPRTESLLTAQVNGRVTRVSPAMVSGGFFAAGEVLVELEASDYQLAYAQAQLNVAQAERMLAEEEADAAVARREWQAVGTGEPSPLALRLPHIKEAKALLESAKAGLTNANLDLERTKLRSVYAGRVRSKHVDVGDYLMPGATVAKVYAVDYAEVRLPLPDDDLKYLALSMAFRDGKRAVQQPKVKLSATFAGQHHEWLARIVRTEGEIDSRTQMVMAVARVEDPYGQGLASGVRDVPLAVGMYVDALIEGEVLDDVFVLPRAALRPGQKLFVTEDEAGITTLRVRDVELLHASGEDVVVRGEGIVDQVTVVVSPLQIAIDGMRVRDLSTAERDPGK